MTGLIGDDSAPLVRVRDLEVHFAARGGFGATSRAKVRAVDGVSFDIPRGETLGLVGESGCGKSTTGRALLRLVPAAGGSVLFDGTDLMTLPARKMRRSRRDMQMIFQDPFSSLDARMKVGSAVKEPLLIHGISTGRSADARVTELLEAVGLPASAAARFPHEFSGGQRQRIAIARALAVDPSFIVCDEPISSLDVSVQAQVMNLFDELQRTLGLTYLFIAHDLAAVRHIAKQIAVMYLGTIVEVTTRDEIFQRPRHPYTQSLISAVPRANPTIERERRRIILSGEIPSPSNPPSGCRFRTRCPFARERCRMETPRLDAAEHSALVACHFWKDIADDPAGARELAESNDG